METAQMIARENAARFSGTLEEHPWLIRFSNGDIRSARGTFDNAVKTAEVVKAERGTSYIII